MRPSHYFQPMSSPSFEAQSEADEKNQNDETKEDRVPHASAKKYQSTSDGDVVVVEPSFDENDGRGPAGDSLPTDMESRSSPLNENRDGERRGHSRNLSEHFFDATTLSNERPSDERRTQTGPYYQYNDASYTASSVGQKHRRGLSAEISNPPDAHRRINSLGEAAALKRREYLPERQHQRADSALDILTAAADVSREELAVAAGARGRGQQHPWEPSSVTASSRHSPVEMLTYDHGPSASFPPPPPHAQSYHVPYNAAHHPPPPYYGAPIAPYPPYPQHPAYYHHPSHAYPRHMPLPPPSAGYPMQYSRAPARYTKSPDSHLHVEAQEPERPGRADDSRPATNPSYLIPKSSREKTQHMASFNSPSPMIPSSHWQGGTTQGVQTLVTTIGVGDNERTLQPSLHRSQGRVQPTMEAAPGRGHHRKSSSLSSLVFLGDTAEVVARGHHRSNSSSVSFLQGLEVGIEGDAAFLHHLQASTGTTASGYSTKQAVKETQALTNSQHSNEDSEDSTKLALGGTSKRVRRKCTVEGCPNRVVQGGLCISHGAKRKQCKHPGCTKNVKKAGLCSTHGPARKRCEAGGCSKVAVQGGRCIAHGAKKKLCDVDNCAKQAILGGMCKKHHDENQGQESQLSPPPVESLTQCIPTNTVPRKESAGNAAKRRTHTRGLSIFQEMSADTVGNLLLSSHEDNPDEEETPKGEGHSRSYSSDYGLF